MSDWNNINEEKVSREHRDGVLKAASSLLRENEIASPSRRWMWSGLGLAFSGLVAAFVLWRNHKDPLGLEDVPSDEVAAAFADPEMLEEAELLMDLEFLEELEDLEQWEET